LSKVSDISSQSDVVEQIFKGIEVGLPADEIIMMIEESTLQFNTYDINTNYNFLHAACFMKNVSLVEKILKKSE